MKSILLRGLIQESQKKHVYLQDLGFPIVLTKLICQYTSVHHEIFTQKSSWYFCCLFQRRCQHNPFRRCKKNILLEFVRSVNRVEKSNDPNFTISDIQRITIREYLEILLGHLTHQEDNNQEFEFPAMIPIAHNDKGCTVLFMTKFL